MQKAMKNNISTNGKNTTALDVRTYSNGEKRKILEYMESFEPYAVAGLIYDCTTGEATKEENVGYTDGKFEWCSQDIFHIRKYDAAVTDEFLTVLN